MSNIIHILKKPGSDRLKKSIILRIALLSVSFVIIAGSMAQSQKNESVKDLTSSQFERKFDRLKTIADRVEELKKRGFLPKAIEEAKLAVDTAENEFGFLSTVNVAPLFTLVELLGNNRQFDEAEPYIEKIYRISDSKDDKNYVSSVSYRIRVARVYYEWGQYEKAEAALNEAKNFINMAKIENTKDSRYKFDSNFMKSYMDTIEFEMERLRPLLEANRFSKKPEDNDNK